MEVPKDGSCGAWSLLVLLQGCPLKSHSCMFARFSKYLPSDTCKTWRVVCNWFAVIGCPSGYCLWYLSVCVILLYLVNARFNDTSNDETVPHLRCVSVLLLSVANSREYKSQFALISNRSDSNRRQ